MADGDSKIHAVIGSDEAEVKRVALELSRKLGGTGDFAVEIIDGQVEVADQAAQRIYATIEALETFGFFGGEKLVWLKNANFLADDRTGGAQATTAALERLTATLNKGLPEGTKFLLSAGNVDKRRSFYKTLDKLAEVQVYDRIDSSRSGWESAAGILVRQLAREKQVTLSESAAELFTLYTGGDRRVISNELEKLRLYVGTAETVGEEHVRLLTPPTRAGVIFELSNTIAQRDLQRSLALMRQLINQGETVIGILLVAVIPTVRSLLLVKDLATRVKFSRPSNFFSFGKVLEGMPATATAHLPRTKEGKLNANSLGSAAMHMHRYQLPELRAALAACLDANHQMLSGGDAEVLLGQLIVRILAKE